MNRFMIGYVLIGVLVAAALSGCVDAPGPNDVNFEGFSYRLHELNNDYIDRRIRLLEASRPQPQVQVYRVQPW